MEERAVILRLQQGDRQALAWLYETYKGAVYRTALAMTRDESVAEDILQESFIRLYLYAATLDPDRPLRPWLYRVTLNLVRDWSRKRRLGHPVEELMEWLSALAAPLPSMEREVERSEAIALVRTVIETLPAAHREVVVLFYLEELSIEEIAETLDIPVGTVKSRLHYARRRLRESVQRRERILPELAYEFT